MTIEFRKPVIEDKAMVTGYIKQKKTRSCEDTFGNLLLWARFYDVQIAEVEDCLVAATVGEELSFHYPYGRGNVKKCIEALESYSESCGKEFQMHCVTPEEFEELESLFPGEFEIEYEREYADYVYEAEKLRTLSGKKYHGKKNHVNRFKKTYENWEYVSLNKDNVEEAFQLLLQWKNLNLCHENHDKNAESCVACNYLRLLEELGVVGGILRVDGKAVAFTIGDQVCDDTMVVHIEKALTEYDGAYAMINQQFVEHECAHVTYVNREDDMGDEGLRKAKLSYHPVFFVEKGIVKRKKL
jgi:hypothetical protein